MDKRELEKIRGLMKELEYLKKQIRLSADRLRTTGDSVRGSSPFYPYIEHTIAIAGIDNADLLKRAAELKEQVIDKIDYIMDKVTEANKYIETIPDADTRIVLQCRFINGLTWREIEDNFSISWTTAHRKYRKWLKGQET